MLGIVSPRPFGERVPEGRVRGPARWRNKSAEARDIFGPLQSQLFNTPWPGWASFGREV
jgi:hypothetical protein